MTKKITVTKLDPTRKVARASISSEHEDMQYFDDQGNRIPYVEVEENYKPSYDGETSNISGVWNRYETDIFRDCYFRIATIRSRWHFTCSLKYIVVRLFDKHIGHHLWSGHDTRKQS